MRYILRTIIRLLFNIIAHVEVNGREYVPAEGNFVIATNHLGIVDAPLAFYALDRWDLFSQYQDRFFALFGKKH